MKNILILNGASRKSGNTSELVRSFAEGAKSSGNKVTEFYLQSMDIQGCLGCEKCYGKNIDPKNPCTQKDDMAKIYEAFAESEIVVFASPVYFWSITGSLKTVADRLYAELRCLGYERFPRTGVLLMTAGGSDYSQAVAWYRHYATNLGWRDLGQVLGRNKTEEARRLGASIG